MTDSVEVAVFMKSAGTSSSVVNGLLIGGAIVNLILSSSLSLLWGMVNTLQLIVHMPLINIGIPGNASYFLQILITIANFEILPSEYLLGKIFNFDGEVEPYNSRFETMGY